MKRNPVHTVDECVGLMKEGHITLEGCLARYPEHAAEIEPLLEIAHELQRMPKPSPRPAAFAAGRRRMLETLAEKRHRQAASPASTRPARRAILGHLRVSMIALAALLVAIVLVFGRSQVQHALRLLKLANGRQPG